MDIHVRKEKILAMPISESCDQIGGVNPHMYFMMLYLVNNRFQLGLHGSRKKEELISQDSRWEVVTPSRYRDTKLRAQLTTDYLGINLFLLHSSDDTFTLPEFLRDTIQIVLSSAALVTQCSD